MAYEAVVRRYLRELEREYNSAVRGGQHTGELSYRAPMHEFFKALARELNPAGSFDIILEPKRQLRVGRSDWRVHDSVSLGIYGYIEAKPLTVDPLDLGPHRSQIDKYLSLGHKLVITDGIDFVFAFPGREAVTVPRPCCPGATGRPWRRILSSGSTWSSFFPVPPHSRWTRKSWSGW